MSVTGNPARAMGAFMSERTNLAIGSLLEWFSQIDVSHFDLAVGRRNADRIPGQFLAPRFTGAQELSVTRIEGRLPWLRAENAAGGDIYFRPFRHGVWPVVFLDDVPPSMAIRIAGKYQAAVVETSPGRCHLWLGTALPLDETQRGRVQRDLVTRLRGAADPGSVSGDHWGRLPGFRNYKPGRNCWVNLRTRTHVRPYLPSLSTPAQGPPVTHPSRREGKDLDMSRLEWGWVRGCLEHGLPASWVLETLIARARHRRGEADAIRYARYTVGKACRLQGLPAPQRGGL